jgi:hypothetical protein
VPPPWISIEEEEPAAAQLSKWFYDTYPITVSRAANEGSLIRVTKTLDAQYVSYDGAWWFTWFEPPEHNTLCLWKNESYYIVVCCSSLGLNLP